MHTKRRYGNAENIFIMQKNFIHRRICKYATVYWILDIYMNAIMYILFNVKLFMENCFVNKLFSYFQLFIYYCEILLIYVDIVMILSL